jgi:hypothetical protein
LEVSKLGGGEDAGGGSRRGEGEDFRLLFVEVDAEWGPQALDFGDKPGEVRVVQEDGGVIDVGGGGSLGALAVIAGATGGKAGTGTLEELGVEGFEELVEHKAGKDGGQRVTLREPFCLGEKIGGAIGFVKVASAGLAVH